MNYTRTSIITMSPEPTIITSILSTWRETTTIITHPLPQQLKPWVVGVGVAVAVGVGVRARVRVGVEVGVGVGVVQRNHLWP